jgi:hypothetical protein
MLKLNRIGVFEEDTLSYVGIIRIRFMGIISACGLFSGETKDKHPLVFGCKGRENSRIVQKKTGYASSPANSMR